MYNQQSVNPSLPDPQKGPLLPGGVLYQHTPLKIQNNGHIKLKFCKMINCTKNSKFQNCFFEKIIFGKVLAIFSPKIGHFRPKNDPTCKINSRPTKNHRFLNYILSAKKKFRFFENLGFWLI